MIKSLLQKRRAKLLKKGQEALRAGVLRNGNSIGIALTLPPALPLTPKSTTLKLENDVVVTPTNAPLHITQSKAKMQLDMAIDTVLPVSANQVHVKSNSIKMDKDVVVSSAPETAPLKSMTIKLEKDVAHPEDPESVLTHAKSHTVKLEKDIVHADESEPLITPHNNTIKLDKDIAHPHDPESVLTHTKSSIIKLEKDIIYPSESEAIITPANSAIKMDKDIVHPADPEAVLTHAKSNTIKMDKDIAHPEDPESVLTHAKSNTVKLDKDIAHPEDPESVLTHAKSNVIKLDKDIVHANDSEAILIPAKSNVIRLERDIIHPSESEAIITPPTSIIKLEKDIVHSDPEAVLTFPKSNTVKLEKDISRNNETLPPKDIKDELEEIEEKAEAEADAESESHIEAEDKPEEDKVEVKAEDDVEIDNEAETEVVKLPAAAMPIAIQFHHDAAGRAHNVVMMPKRSAKGGSKKKKIRLVAQSTGLQALNLGKSYGDKPAVRDVSITVHRGEAVGLLGPNGAGKTTSFYMIMGLIKPDYGTIMLDGNDITSLPVYRRARLGIGYLPQEASIFRGLTVEENILSVLELIEPVKENRQIMLEELLAEFSISHLRRTPAVALSGGERRRVEIARALASNPSFILLDEPLAGIDPVAVNDIKELISHLKHRGIGVLITDHNVREALDLLDRAYVIHNGTVLMEGTPKEIVVNKEVRRVYLGEKFVL